ncbi:hypothetical protein C2G38_2063670, partial [Gigaspora rosea]
MIDPSLYKNNLQKFSDNTIDNWNIPSPDKLPQSIIDSLKKLKNKSRVIAEAIKQRALEKKAEMDKITQALRKNDGTTKSKNHIIFSDNDLAPEVSDNFNLFDSDEEYNNNEKPTLDISINTIFEGESGRERLNLQKKFRSDDQRFVSDDENIETDENNI